MSSSILSKLPEIEASVLKDFLDLENPERKYEKYSLEEAISEKIHEIIKFPLLSCSSNFIAFLKKNSKTFNAEILKPFLFSELYLREGSLVYIKGLEKYLQKVKNHDFDKCGIQVLRSELVQLDKGF